MARRDTVVGDGNRIRSVTSDQVLIVEQREDRSAVLSQAPDERARRGLGSRLTASDETLRFEVLKQGKKVGRTVTEVAAKLLHRAAAAGSKKDAKLFRPEADLPRHGGIIDDTKHQTDVVIKLRDAARLFGAARPFFDQRSQLEIDILRPFRRYRFFPQRTRAAGPPEKVEHR